MPKTILILAANPKNTSRLRLDQEVREIDNGLQRAKRRDEFRLEQKWAVRPADVRRSVLDLKPNIVHFCGHGEGEEGIAFEDETGYAKLVDAEALAGFFELFADKVKCVVLNACYSEVQAESIAQHIDFVIGMKKGIGDVPAIEFAVAFYDALGAGESFEFAYRLACNAIQWTGIPEHLTPILKSKAVSEPRSWISQDRKPVLSGIDQREGATVAPKEETSSGMQFYHGYALLIGVGDDLPVAESDARALGEFLADPMKGGYHPSQVNVLVGSLATKQGIMEAFDELINQTEGDSRAMSVVFLSGYGGRFLTPDRMTQYYLLPAEYDLNNRAGTMISGKELSREIAKIKAVNLLVILDCCHSGGIIKVTDPDEKFVKSMADRDMITALQRGSGRVIIASSRENEFSYIAAGGSHSIFISCLLEALQGKASVSKDGYARILDVVSYLANRVPILSKGRQHPLVRMTGVGSNFPICYYAGGKREAD